MKQLKTSDRERACLDTYILEIEKIDPIFSNEEIVLIHHIKSGDLVALKKLTKANLRFVVLIAKQYQNQGLSFFDLIYEGNLGLIKAAKSFEETHGLQFITYAVLKIKQSISRALAA